MKLLSLGLALLGSASAQYGGYTYGTGYGYGDGFLSVKFGADSKWGTVSWIAQHHLMVFAFPSETGCDGYATTARVYNNPAAVNDFEVPAPGEEKAVCGDLGAMKWQGNVSWSYDSFGKECIGIGSYKGWDTWYVMEFNTVTLFDGTANTGCATMTGGNLNYGWAAAGEDTEAMRIHTYRSACRKSKAYHGWFADARTSWTVSHYKRKGCRGPMVGSAWTITDSTKQSWHRHYTTWKSRSFKVDGVCFNERAMNWNKSKAKYCAIREGLEVEFCQDSIFEPTVYTTSYNPNTAILTEQAGGYHIHKLPTDEDDLFSCGDTSGHFNPYAVTEPGGGWPAAGTAGHYSYETGDLSRRYGSLDGKAAGWEMMWCDYNIPLHGMNNVKEMSVVWHKASDNSRYTCANIYEKPKKKYNLY